MGTATETYWEERARRFAVQGAGLKAVCSYGMPLSYNLVIDACQRAALDAHLRPASGAAVLDVGCGIGRWSLLLARRGARVTGVDLSPTMVAEARRRAGDAGLAESCRFQVGDVTSLALEERFSLVLAVTVLQHLLEPERLDLALERLRDHLAPGGRIVLLEAAPGHATSRCDSPVFRARTESVYRQAFTRAGLSCLAVRGVDPLPLRTLLLPHWKRLPRPLGALALLGVSAASLVFDLALAPHLAASSWHKVFVLEVGAARNAGGSGDATGGGV